MTGGSGFVGGALVRRLVEDGREVRALARSDVARRRIAELGATPLPGDVMDPDTLAVAMRGCTTVFHAAGESQVAPISSRRCSGASAR